MDAVQQLAELEAIRRLKARYFRCMDTKDWAGWAQVFTPDATLEFDLDVSTLGRPGNPAPKIAGRDAIVEFVSRVFATNETVHHGHMPEIDFTSDTEARGIWAMEDIVDHGNDLVHAYGHYHDTYVKAGGEWRIATVHLTRLRVLRMLKGGMSV